MGAIVSKYRTISAHSEREYQGIETQPMVQVKASVQCIRQPLSGHAAAHAEEETDRRACLPPV